MISNVITLHFCFKPENTYIIQVRFTYCYYDDSVTLNYELGSSNWFAFFPSKKLML